MTEKEFETCECGHEKQMHNYGTRECREICDCEKFKPKKEFENQYCEKCGHMLTLIKKECPQCEKEFENHKPEDTTINAVENRTGSASAENHKPEEIAKTKSEGIPKTDVTSGDFVLSEKRIWFKDNSGKIHYVYPEEDIKEFIRRLKEVKDWKSTVEKKKPYQRLLEKDIGWNNAIDNFLELIDKLAGEKLTGK